MSAVLTNVYNHYLTTYAPKGTTQYDTHKKSELRGVYNSIVKMNKDTPWFLPVNKNETLAYAVGLKEHARELRNTIASLGGLSDEQLLNKKIAYCDNNNVAGATFIGEYKEGDEIPELELEVKSLATSQENLGRYLADEKVTLPSDTYSFDIATNGFSYEFQFNIKEEETNLSVQKRLMKLINNNNIGITADLHETENGTALRLTSNNTGCENEKGLLFTVSDTNTGKTAGTVAYLGLDYVSRKAANASFLLNGEERSATSNNFTVGKLYEIELKGISEEGHTAKIGLKTDLESVTENAHKLVGGYNAFLKAVDKYIGTFPKSSRLSNEMGSIAYLHKNELSSIGLNLQDDNRITVDEKLMSQTVSEENVPEFLSTIKDFATSLVQKTAQVSLDPMKYVDKTVVAYKNPGHTFTNPYAPSPYSGMLFNSYC